MQGSTNKFNKTLQFFSFFIVYQNYANIFLTVLFVDSVDGFQKTISADIPDSDVLIPGSLRGWFSVIGI
jgi:hypothetical protein